MLGRPHQHTTAGPHERDIFLEALEKPTPELRQAYLDHACGRDQVLRSTVEGLLQNHREDLFLETPAPGVPSVNGLDGVGSQSFAAEQIGDRIGGYRLLEQIGEGGYGTVYLAEQEQPVRRRVALKVIKLGMDTKQVIARFEAERQALAMMDHLHIAKVLEAGATVTGRPYFVMELVRGVKITEYCDQNHLPLNDRLLLFVQVCQAIQHAHQKGVIHRDIKPSNILITLHDGLPVPKVIDFGIAKATELRLTDKTLHTDFRSFLGTPAYTSPEQAEMSGLDIDTRSDIYSLGVLLYQLLTGQTPCDPGQLLHSTLDEMRRLIREEEPPPPSARISRLGMDEATTLTRTHCARLPALVQTMRGDLDWIAMKCLEKDRSRRYATANALALDITRYLEDEPVLARPPSRIYRIQKFVRRNRLMASACAVVGLVLMVGSLVSTWLAIRAIQAEHEQSRLHLTAQVSLKKEARLRQQAQIERLAALRQAYNSDMNLVQQALAANNYGRVINLLERHNPEVKPDRRTSPTDLATSHSALPDFRQWEWRYFWGQSRNEALFRLPKQSTPVSALSLSPDGKLLLFNGFRNQIRLWDLDSKTQLVMNPDDRPSGTPFAFSHDGSLVASTVNREPRRSAIRLWQVAARQTVAELADESGIDALAFSPDDSRLIAIGQDKVIRTWDVGTRQLLSQIRMESVARRGFGRAAISADTQLAAIVAGDRIRLVEIMTGRERSSTESLETEIASLAFSPNGDLLAAGPLFSGTATAISLFSTSSGKNVGQLRGHASWVPSLAFTSDGQRLISAGADQTIRIWNIRDRQEIATRRGHESEIYCVAVAPDGKSAISGCKDGSIFGWDCEHLERNSPFEALPVRVESITFFPNSRFFLSVNQDRAMASDPTVSVWDAATLQNLGSVPKLRPGVGRLLISPDGSRVYAGMRSGGLTVLDWATRQVITNLPMEAGQRPPLGPGNAGGPVGLVDQGRTLVVETHGPTIRLFDTASWQPKGEWKAAPNSSFRPNRALPLLSPDQRSVALISDSGTAEFRNLWNGDLIATVAIQTGRVSGMAFSPDGRLFATSAVDGTVNLWNAAQSRLVDVLRGHLLGIEALAFSPDGQRLATASHGNEAVKIWDTVTLHEVATLAGEGSLFRSVQFSPDGKLLVGINIQGQAHFWRAPALEETRLAISQ